jgi:LuxR family maltose regulon positive regulatory protein
VFLDEGRPMEELLRTGHWSGPAGDFARLLVADPVPAPVASNGSTHDLSPRELEVLRLLRSELSGPDIARELVVSLNTMRTHTKSIYTKLGATNRREAVRRAAELGL